jgi:Uma2 family endonuclease
MSLDEFLAWERQQPENYEYARGVITMMTGGSLDYSTIASNLWTALRDRLRGTPCRAFRGDTKVITNNSVRHPDLSVTCSSVRGDDVVVRDPVFLVEVISPSAEREDRGRKKFDYFATASVLQYAIVEQDERRIELFTRADARWTDENIEGNAVLNLSSLGIEISSDTIYEDTELDAIRRRGEERQAPAV